MCKDEENFFISFFILWSKRLIIVGSNSAVSVQSNITFPATDSNNTMLGYAAFSNGFTLSGNGTTTANIQ